MKHFLNLLFLSVLLLLASCHGSRQVQSPASVTADPAVQKADLYKKQVAATAVTARALTARIKMDINAAGRNVSVGGSLRMKRDEVIQLSLTFLGMEVGRMEFSPENVLIVDRINTQFVRATYDQVSFLQQAGLDFYALQSLFWNELFVPGQRKAEVPLGRFRVSSAGAHTLLSLPDAPKLEYSFLTVTSTALIDRVTVRGKELSQKGELVWRYGDFTAFDGKKFPSTMSVAVTGLGKDAGFTLSLSRLGTSTDWESHTKVSAKYKQRNADDILKRLLSM